MATEIERKFLVNPVELYKALDGIEPIRIAQAYLSLGKATVRVRTENKKGYLVVKGEKKGLSCAEYDYEIPLTDAQEMIQNLATGLIVVKKRYKLPYGKHTWDIDIFQGVNAGLIVAEVEMASEGENIELPDWVTQEVSHDPMYLNSQLAMHPYAFWHETD